MFNDYIRMRICLTILFNIYLLQWIRQHRKVCANFGKSCSDVKFTAVI